METIRTFIAVEASAEVRQAAAHLVATLLDRGQAKPEGARSRSSDSSKVKWVERDNLHFTLNFLGDVPAESVPEVCHAAKHTASGHQPFNVTVGRVGASHVAAATHDMGGRNGGAEAMQRLQANLEAELEPLGFRGEDRGYTPHLTIGRVRFLAHGDDLPQRLHLERDFAAGTMNVAKVVVFSSQLGSGGSTYTPLARVPLGRS